MMSVTSQENVAPPLQRALQAVAAVRQLALARDRSDFVARLDAAKDRLENLRYQVLIVGEYKKGKSTLINSLVNAEVCPTDDDIATARPIMVHHAPEPMAELLLAAPAGDDGAEAPAHPPGGADLDADDPAPTLVPPLSRPIDVSEIRQWATDDGGAETGPPVRAVRVGLPRTLLSSGLVLVDTPGIGGLRSPQGAATVRLADQADGVLFVSDASQEYTQSELDYLHAVRQLCPNVVCVMTKIDFYPSWRRMVEGNQAHLRRAGIDSVLIATSAPLRQAAIERNDRELNVESGYADLVSILRTGLGARAQALAVERVLVELREVLGQLDGQIEAELAVLEDPDRAEAVVRELQEAKARAEALRGRAAKWQQTLSDGTSDLVADIEHHLRAQFRELVRQADEAIDSSDPGKTWDEFEPWLVNAVGTLLTAHHTYQRQRADYLAWQVAQHFGDDAALTTDLLPSSSPVSLAETVGAKFDNRRYTVTARGVTAVRGTYGGVAMVSMLAAMTGIGALVIPVGLSIGALLGSRAVRDEKKRLLAQRRAQGKQAVHRYSDDILFRASKDTRDTLRLTQRQLRDFYAARAEELNRSTVEALTAVQQSIKADQETRTNRHKELLAERKTCARARELLSSATAAADDTP